MHAVAIWIPASCLTNDMHQQLNYCCQMLLLFIAKSQHLYIAKELPLSSKIHLWQELTYGKVAKIRRTSESASGKRYSVMQIDCTI